MYTLPKTIQLYPWFCYSIILFPTFDSCVKGADDSTVASAVAAAYSRSHPSTYGRSHSSTDRSPDTAANSGEWAYNVMYVCKWAGGRLNVAMMSVRSLSFGFYRAVIHQKKPK